MKKADWLFAGNSALYTDMTVKEYLNFLYDLKKVTLPREKHLKEICDLVRINEVYDRLIANLSRATASVSALRRRCWATRRCSFGRADRRPGSQADHRNSQPD